MFLLFPLQERHVHHTKSPFPSAGQFGCKVHRMYTHFNHHHSDDDGKGILFFPTCLRIRHLVNERIHSRSSFFYDTLIHVKHVPGIPNCVPVASANNLMLNLEQWVRVGWSVAEWPFFQSLLLCYWCCVEFNESKRDRGAQSILLHPITVLCTILYSRLSWWSWCCNRYVVWCSDHHHHDRLLRWWVGEIKFTR